MTKLEWVLMLIFLTIMTTYMFSLGLYKEAYMMLAIAVFIDWLQH
jgi:hypothetical protein